MTDPVEFALDVDVSAAATAVQLAAVGEAERQADALLGEPPLPGSIEWHAEDGTGVAERRQRAWQLLLLRIGLAAGLDPVPVLIGLVNHGATWAEIGRAAALTPEAAEARWSGPVSAILHRS